MEQSILNLQDYTAASSWRRRDQLRGLLSNHADLVTSRIPLAAEGVLFTSAQIALHNTEKGLAVSLSPLMGTSAVGLMPLDEAVPSLNAAARMRWLDMAEGTKTSCVEWCEDLLFLGSSRGRVLVCDVPVASCRESSGLLSPCGALLTRSSEVVLSRVTVPPSAPASSTLVRSVRVNQCVSKTSVLAAQDTSVYLWDLTGGSLPVQRWLPHRHIDAATPVMFAEWAPGSASVVLSGTYDSSVMLVDTRSAAASNSVAFSCRRAGGCPAVAHCGDFNPLLPSIVAVSFSDGTVAVYDARYPLQAVQTVTTLQGDAVRLRWWRHNADLLTTAGSDGSVALWNLRCPPSFCVGRAQYQMPLSDLAMTNTFSDQRAIGITVGGELTMTGLQPEALMGLAPTLSYGNDEAERRGSGGPSRGSTASPPTPPITAAEEEALRKEEHDACGFLYLRRLKEAYQMLAQCASRRLALHQTDVAMQLISHIDVVRVPLFDYAGFVEQLHSAAKGVDDVLQVLEENGWSYETIRLQFEASVLHCSSHLSTTVALDRIRAMSKPNPSDVQTLEALRLNVMLHRVLDSEDVDQVVVSVRTALDLIMAHPGISELIDVQTVEQIVRLLLRKNYPEGERFVQFLLSQLRVDREQTGVPYQLLRAAMSAAQEPSVTMGMPTRAARRFVERFYRDMAVAKDAVLTQLHIQRLGVEHYREVITIVNAYQERCIQKNLPGMFGWVALKPLLLFLHCLTADSNYVTFFWVSVQYIEAFAHFPGVRKVEAVLFAVVDRIHSAAGKITNDLDELTDTTRFSIPMLRHVDNTLSTTHEFLTVLIRVQLDCENVAVARNMRAMPPVMEQVQDVLNSASEDVLEAWAGVMDALLECDQPDMIRKYCLATVRTFSEQMEDLMEVSAKGEADERLNEILDVCDDFFAAVAPRKAKGGDDA
ncbi:hypothetical protein, conserved [Leishmania donovani]|uniref:Uncharacterized protein n=1 Tax=Leishmania donovani TaxID=5661 RepID=A0A3S7WWR2_LEIDO|nr:hypothetical protein, conserved [Leishmania donovani]AYU78656.1 hypothetical protein LdCL_210024800 [Leishmania donovani]TPP49406.1 hypothetical protein CGC21_34570 [Leishmania donovani]CBZ34003.1 hypothetical protein, conserved [Leishmania donovani]